MNRLQTRPAARSNGSGSGALFGVLLGIVAAVLIWFTLLATGDPNAVPSAITPTIQSIQPTPTLSAPAIVAMDVGAQAQITPTTKPAAEQPAVAPTAIPATLVPIAAPVQVQPNIDPLNFWYSEFFNNVDMEGSATVQRNDQDLNFNFRTGSADPRLPADNFSGRFKGRFTFDRTENNQFSLIVDDAARVYLDDRLIIDEWHMGGRRTATANVAVVKGEHHLRVEYAETTGNAQLSLTWKVHYDAWQCRYYNTTDWTGQVIVRTNEGAINGKLIQDWGEGGPGNGVANDNFSADCWIDISAAKTGEYTFKLLADDGMRVYVDGIKVYDNLNGPIQADVPIRLRAGRHKIQTQYVERGGGAAQHIDWVYVPPPAATPVPTALPGS